jgi:hypothetical protein
VTPKPGMVSPAPRFERALLCCVTAAAILVMRRSHGWAKRV